MMRQRGGEAAGARAPAILGLLAVDPRADRPLQAQIYRRLREEILAGRLRAGTRLPATRTIAGDLGVARNTVVAAFERLLREGYLVARVGSGTRVADLPPDALLAVAAPPARRTAAGKRPRLSRRGAALVAARRPTPHALRRAFQPGLPELAQFPHGLWARLLQRHAREPTRGTLGYAHGGGVPALRAAIARYVGAARGVACEAEQVFVLSGAQAALDLVARLLLDPGDRVWLEDPGYLGARAVLRGAGARLAPVPVDGEGIRVEWGERWATEARLVYCTPSHQFPTGATMTLGRRVALLEWAATTGAWVVEDDFDSEYRYGGRPIPAMQGIDAGGRVLYVGTFSKTMFPALRVGFVVAPAMLVDVFGVAMRNTGHAAAAVVQAALADFLEEGHFAAHVRRMRGLYARRQAALVAAAGRYLRGRLAVAPMDAGMQIAATLEGAGDDRELSRALADAGLVAPPLSVHWLGAARSRGLLLGYAGVPEREIAPAVQVMARVLGA